MKYLALSIMAATGMILASACNDQGKANAATEAQVAPALSSESKFEDKVSYSIGASVGTYIATVRKEQGDIIGDLDQDLIVQGFIEALNGSTSLSEEEIAQTLMTLDNKVRESVQQKQAAEATKNLAEGKKFLEENAKKKGITVTKSGLQYEVLSEGKGASPKATDTVSVLYKGFTIDGAVFDQQLDTPVSFALDSIIPGWTEGLQLMKVGAKYKFYIPSELAYGEAGAGDIIKPNSVLIFEVELKKIGE